MLSEGERIKALRKALNIKQGQFADIISTTQGHISDIENGRKSLSERTIKLICLENWDGKYVSESWLRTGKGEMFAHESTDDLSELIKKYDLSDADCVLLEKFIKLKPSSRKIITDFVAETARTINDLDLFSDIPATPEELEEKYPPVEIGDNKVG